MYWRSPFVERRFAFHPAASAAERLHHWKPATSRPSRETAPHKPPASPTHPMNTPPNVRREKTARTTDFLARRCMRTVSRLRTAEGPRCRFHFLPKLSQQRRGCSGRPETNRIIRSANPGMGPCPAVPSPPPNHPPLWLAWLAAARLRRAYMQSASHRATRLG